MRIAVCADRRVTRPTQADDLLIHVTDEPTIGERAVLDGFTPSLTTYDGVEKTVYRLGAGPAVIVLHEIPGITPAVAAFCRRVADAGFTVLVPSLFGTPGRAPSRGYSLNTMARVCVSREFHCLALREPSPVTSWLRSLAADAHVLHGGPGVGVVGMCITGGFGLAMMADPSVIAPVLSQPSMPLAISRGRRAAIGLRDADWRIVRHRIQGGCQVVGLRFTADRLSPSERFQLLREQLGDDVILVEIDSSSGNPAGIPVEAHSVLTESFVDSPGHPTSLALGYVIGFLQEKLLDRAPPQPPSREILDTYAGARRDVVAELSIIDSARRGSHVFLSYAHEDAAYVTALQASLEERGIPAWYDAHIPTGAKWADVLRERLDTSAAIVVIMSIHAGSSEWVAREIVWAQERKKAIAPVLLSGPPLLILDEIQYYDAADGQLPDSRFYEDLVAAMHASS
jgi:dienelactone hydrolase